MNLNIVSESAAEPAYEGMFEPVEWPGTNSALDTIRAARSLAEAGCGAVITLGGDLDTARVQAQRVAERDQLVGALGGHGAGDDRGVEHRPLGGGKARSGQRARYLGRQAHARFSERAPRRHRLAANVDHGWRTVWSYVCESLHQPPM